MVVYLEGADGSGKSTLAKAIEQYYTEKGYKCVLDAESLINTHPKRPNRITGTELFIKLEQMCRSDLIYILDRGPISDLVYRVFDNYESVTNLESLINFLEPAINLGFLKLIYCKSSKAEEAMRERGDDNPTALNKYKELSKVYDLVMSAITVRSYIINYDFHYFNKNQLTNFIRVFVSTFSNRKLIDEGNL